MRQTVLPPDQLENAAATCETLPSRDWPSLPLAAATEQDCVGHFRGTQKALGMDPAQACVSSSLVKLGILERSKDL